MPTDNFCRHQEKDDGDKKVPMQQISGGLNDDIACAMMILGDPFIDKAYLANHEEHRLDYIQKSVHDHHYHHRHVHQRRRGRPLSRFNPRMSSGCNNSNTPARTCVDCNTTETPLWRTGPPSPKSLCNACGIKHRRARRAQAFAAAHGQDCHLSPVKPKTQKRAEDKYCSVHHKRKDKTLSVSDRRRKKICFELDGNGENGDENQEYAAVDFSVEPGDKAKASKRDFPEDEEEAAILLMALSCGLVPN